MARKIPNAAIVAPITLLIGSIIVFTHISFSAFFYTDDSDVDRFYDQILERFKFARDKNV